MPTINGDEGHNQLVGGTGGDTINGFGGNDLIDGDGGDDTLNGGAGNDVLYGFTGNDRLNGEDGDDILEGEAGNDTLNGGAGFDIASYLNAANAVTVNLSLSSQNTGVGNDTFISIEGVFGSAFNDRLTGDAGANLLDGGRGADWLSGGDGDDILQIFEGADVVTGDRFSGGSGFDTLYVVSNAGLAFATIDADVEALVANAGVELSATQLGGFSYIDVVGNLRITTAGLVDLTDATQVIADQIILDRTGITLDLTGVQTNALKIDGSAGDDIVRSGLGNDQILGFTGNDTLGGGGGDDFLSGFEGDDILDGGSGDDLIAGGIGNDILRGGDGNDRLQETRDDGSDQLFGGAGDDVIELYLSPRQGTSGDTDINVLDGGSGNDRFSLVGNASDLPSGWTLTGGTGVDRVEMGYYWGANADMTRFVLDSIEELVGTQGCRLTAAQLDGLTYLETGDGNNRLVTITTAGVVDIRDATQMTDLMELAVGGVVLTAAGGQFTLDIRGSAGVDTVTGGALNDTIVGNAGNDVLDGGGGSNTTRFSGARAQYTIISEADGWLRVTGPDGSDLIRSFQTVVFDDQTMYLAEGLNFFGTALDETARGDALGDILLGEGGNDHLIGAGGDDRLTGGDGDDRLEGGVGNDSLIGGNGNDIIDGGGGTDFATGDAGNDWFANLSEAYGGSGNDSYIGINRINDTDGIDSVYWYGDSYALMYSSVENLYFSWDAAQTPFGQGYASTANKTAAGSAVANTIVGAGGNDTFDGNGGDDVLSGRAGNDVLNGGDGLDQLNGGDGADVLDGGAGNDQLFGNAGADQLRGGGEGQNILDGGDDVDTAIFSGHRSIYTIVLVNGVTTVTGPSGTDTLINIERLQFDNGVFDPAGNILPVELYGTPNADTLIGTDLADLIAGGAGDDVIIGGRGSDIIDGGTGIDTAAYAVGALPYTVTTNAGTVTVATADETDTLTNVEQLRFAYVDVDVRTLNGLVVIGGDNGDILAGATTNDRLYGFGGADTLNGGDGDDRLVGGGGADILNGGSGSDTVDYSAATWAVTARLDAQSASNDGDGGADTFTSIENLTGSAFNDLLIGDASANTLSGGLGRDVIIAGGGNDIISGGAGQPNELYGGAGDDTYIVEERTDSIVELAGEGVDTVLSALFQTNLSANVENLTYVGTGTFTGVGNAIGNTITGGLQRDVLLGQGGDDILIGGAGAANELYGGVGNDTYVLDVADSIIEGADSGTDTVQLRNLHAYNLGANVENGMVVGTGDFVLNGNALDNVLTGGAGADTLQGGAGNDTLNGGAGVDTVSYILSTGGVYARVDVQRGINDGMGGADTFSGVENLVGSNLRDTLMGDAGNNVIDGAIGDDVLLGFDGNDTLIGGSGGGFNEMYGGRGDDLFIVTAGDTLIELAGEGIDTVQTSNGAFTLAANIEILTYTGTGNFGGTGNAGGNTINGGAGNDTLAGRGGDDTLNGGAGTDVVLLQGVQADYAITAVNGGWRVVDSVTGRDGTDTLFGIETLRFADGTVRALGAAPAAVSAILDISDSKPGLDDAFVLPALPSDKAGFDLPLVLPDLDPLPTGGRFALFGDDSGRIVHGAHGLTLLPGDALIEDIRHDPWG